MGEIKRGEIYLVDLGETKGSVQGGIRPAIILQNDVGNHFSPTTLICPLTSKKKKEMPTHVTLPTTTGLQKESVALCEQIRVIDKTQLTKRICDVADENIVDEINRGIMVSFGLCTTNR